MEQPDKLNTVDHFDRSNGPGPPVTDAAARTDRDRRDDAIDDSFVSEDVDPAFADLFFGLQERLQAGERPDVEALVAQYPAWADRIRRLLPAVQGLAEIGRPVDDERALPAAGRGGIVTGDGRIFGDFRIIREIGRGGMGVVYEAEQVSFQRRVALKVLSAAAVVDARALERFQLEARVAGCLRHPGIVSVFGVGDVDGVPYFSMPFIEGGNLADLIAELRGYAAAPAESFPGALASGMLSGRFLPMRRGLDGQRLPAAIAAASAAAGLAQPVLSIRSRSYVRSVVRLGIQAAEALGYAHDQGIVHRDVKPANLLLDPHGDLWVADFGMAEMQGNPGLTMPGDVPGTLRYMSPEQAAGRRALVDRRTDVYSLGATLYELLTLQPAVIGADRQEILRRIAEEEPAPIRKLVPTVPVDLATIAAKALAKDPSNRYETAWDLADDLLRFQEGQPILARPVGPLARTWRWCRRKPAQAALAAALVLSVVVGFAGITWAWHDAVRLRRAAQAGQAAAEAAEAAALARAAKFDAINRFLTAKMPQQNVLGYDRAAVRAAELEVLDRAAAEVGSSFREQPEIEAEIRVTIARNYHSLQAYEKCEAQYREADEVYGRIPGADALAARAELGHCLYHLNRLDEAEAVLVPAFDGMTRGRGPTDQGTIGCGRYLVTVYDAQKRYVEAEALQRRLWATLKAAHGPTHPDALMAHNSLADILRKEKKYVEAEPYLRECLERMREVFGPRHPYTLSPLHRLGEVLMESGKLDEAESLLRECLEAHIQISGTANNATLHSMSSLASLLVTRDRLEEAEALLRRCLEGRRQHHGADDLETKRVATLLDEVVKKRAASVGGARGREAAPVAPAAECQPFPKQ